MVRPYIGTSRSRLTQLLNLANNTHRAENVDFTYGPPLGEIDHPHGKNTSVVLTPVAGTLYRGPVRLYYNRLSLSIVGDLPSGSVRPAIIPSAPFWIRDYLDEINAALGLDLIPDEVVNTYYSSLSSHYRLYINGQNSHAWLDSSLEFSAVRTAGERLPLELYPEVEGFVANEVAPAARAVIPNSLGGFIQAVTYRRSLALQSEVDSFVLADYVPNPSAHIPTNLSGFAPATTAS